MRKNNYVKYGILVASVIIMVPIMIDHLIIGNNFPSNIDNEQWVSFLGSYVGALIGAAITLIGLVITLKFTMAQNKEERRLTVAPYFKYTMHELPSLATKDTIDIYINHRIDENPNTPVHAIVSLKNIGVGPVMDLRIYNILFKGKKVAGGFDYSNNTLENGSELLMNIYLEAFLEKIDNNNLKKNPPEYLHKYSPQNTPSQKGGKLSMCIGYSDLIGNKYEQILEFNVRIGGHKGYIKSDDEYIWEYFEPAIGIHKTKKSKIVKEFTK